ncbi:MAG: hypothetical protein AB1589_10745 [Cyanobacteriota bacterium]
MSTRSSSLLDSPTAVEYSLATKSPKTAGAEDPRVITLMKSLYQADQQVKYLHLQAEVDSLLQHLQILKQQRISSDVNIDSGNQRQ